MTLVVTDVAKTYRGAKQALAGLSLDVGPGVLGLLGPNGAGKSTLMQIVSTITRPSQGSVTWQGADVVAEPDSVRRVLGYLPQDFGVYPNLNAREFLAYLAAVKGLSARSARARIDELLELVNLTDAAGRALGGYSGGMRQRVGIAQALLNDPRLLVVDEPTAGLDPEERVRFRNLLADLGTDRVVILSTHVVSDVEAVTGDIAVMAEGRLLHRGSVASLLRRAEGQVWEVTADVEKLMELRARHVVSRSVRSGGDVLVRLLADAPPLAGAVPVQPDLEDAYLAIVHDPAPAGHSLTGSAS